MKLKHHSLSALGSRLRVTLPILAAIMGMAGNSVAALPQPGKILSCAVSDKVTQTVVAGQIVTAGTTSISISMALGEYGFDGEEFMVPEIIPIDLSTITDGTTIKLQIGGYSYEGSLGSDPNIATNLNKRAIFIPANLNPATNKPIGSNGLKVAWTSTKVTFTVLRSLTDQTDNGSPLAKSLLQIAQTVGTTSTILDQLPITLEFGDFKSSKTLENDGYDFVRPCYIKGTRAVAAKVISGQTYNLNTITLTGAIDTVIPTLTVTVPNGGITDATGAITVTGKVTDAYDIAFVGEPYVFNEVTSLEEPRPALITQTIKGPPQGAPLTWYGATDKNWSLSFTDLPYGRATRSILVEDKSGNYKYMEVVLTRKLPPQLVGRWDTLLLSETDSLRRGYLTFNVTDTGAISGSYRLDNTSTATSFTGSWLGTQFYIYLYKIGQVINGEVSSPESISTQTVVDLQMPISLMFEESGENAAGVAYRTPFNTKNVLPADSPFLGTFNGKLGGSVGGNGHFSIVTSNAGLNTISGKLSDGTSFTASSAVGAAGQVSFFTNLYSNKGYLMSQQLRTNGAFVDDVDPSVDWVRPASFTDKQFPAGFILGLTTQIRRYNAPASNTRILGLTTPNLVASWSGDGVTGTATRNLLLSTANAVTLNGVGTAFNSKIVTKTGLVTGTFALPTVPASTAAYSALIVGDAITGHYIAPAPIGTVQKRYGSFSMGPPAP